MAATRGLNQKHIREKMKTNKFVCHDFDYISFKDAKEIMPELTKEQYEKGNQKKLYSFKECYRFLDVMYDWFMSNEDAAFFQEFFYFSLPQAIEAGDVKKFGFVVSKDTLVQIKLHFPVLADKITTIKELQDYRIFKKGLTGEWYQGLVSFWLRTHSKAEWTETIKQEIVNKTQILSIDPLESNDNNENEN